ncbi:MAG: ABC transporter ATP-binding protein [Bacilli bacterium]|nr:ABC transporter ATP-binding protein [Bacillales bacterium]MDY2575727.1 ABC transporter ATP-binding protein [Bacilli bacterium]
MKEIIKSIKPCLKETILTPILMIGEVLMEVFIPYIVSVLLGFLYIINENPTQANSLTIEIYDKLSPTLGNLGLISLSGLLIVVCSVISLLFGVGGAKVGAKAGGKFAQSLRENIYYNIQSFSFENIDKFQTSSLITRLTTDVTNVQQAFVMIIRLFVRAPIMFVMSLIMCLSTNVKLSLIYVVSIPVLVVGLMAITVHVHPIFKNMFSKYDVMNERLQENLIGIRVVKSFNREEFEIEKFNKSIDEMRDLGIKAEKVLAFNGPIMNLVMYATTLAICYFGTKFFIIKTTMGIPELNLFLSYSSQMLSSLMVVSSMFVMVVMSRASVIRISEVIKEKSTLSNKENPLYEVKDGTIDFENVDFSYNRDKENLNLEKINLHINSGEMVGIIGGTGSSKTTLVNLIPRLYDVLDGSIKVGGVDVRDYDLETLRNQVSVVLQKNVLFSGSIRDNLKWGNKEASDEEILEACKSAQAYDFVMKSEKGLDTDLGQGGCNVSGGQKQRLCIARALLKNPKVLILDDSTSAVDTKTDALIRKALRENVPSITKIIIAQRINSIMDADKIIVLDEGKIDAIGTHEELLKNNKIYQEVYSSQMKGDE